MSLFLKVQSLAAEQQIDLHHKRVLLALSGGIDSVVLAEVLHQAGVRFGIAHCNFQLRGKESDGDEALAGFIAAKYNVPFFSTRFDTEQYVAERKVSIQVAARELRYKWLYEVMEANGFYYLATAHHLDDNIETVVYNFIKGTGIKGLRGMLPKSGRLIRPLLSATRDEIEAFQRTYDLAYREDSSNASDKYIRNKIRHNLIPLISEINPGFQAGFEDRLRVLSDLEDVYDRRFRSLARELFLQRDDGVYIPIARLRQLKARRSILFEYLRSYGFNAAQVDDMLGALDSDSGRQFLSGQARIIKDRRFFILTDLSKNNSPILIENTDQLVALGAFTLQLSTSRAQDAVIQKDRMHAYLDLDRLAFPLLLRPWRQGDYFYPFGMKLKKKKVSKYFKDRKLALHQKEAVWILESGQRIVWIVGEQIDERFRVTDATSTVLHIHQKKLS